MKAKLRKKGGSVKAPADAGGNKDVMKEAAERKDGGKVVGRKSGGRLDKKCRASGGRANATSSPFSSAHRPMRGDA